MTPPPSESAATAAPLRQAAAFFDLDGTLARTTITHYYAYFKCQDLPPWKQVLWKAGFLARCVGFLVIDAYDRGLFNRVFYRGYRGLSAAKLKAEAQSCFEKVLRPRLFPAAVAEVERFKREGRRVVLVTGSLDFIVEPLARELGVSDVVAARLEEWDGRFTGRLADGPICDAVKADRVRALASTHGIDLANSYAYGDGKADYDMLKAVGHGVLVNVSPRKFALSPGSGRGWALVNWGLKNRDGAKGAPSA